LAQYPGIYKIINKETARNLLGKVKWINRESDMEVAGLREAKLRYHPEHFVKAYYIVPEDIPATLS
ncbi:MAG TPA: phosphatidylglycerol lysyltransferase domain-containing protein, partial [Methanocorpusculum sp.]|nr:phosphatidylglycerol lysyltransferase domain-containing protein [Methanocorpusculum sp.]